MKTIQNVLDEVDHLKPSAYEDGDKLEWLSTLESRIVDDLLKTHEGTEYLYEGFEGYDESTDRSKPLMIQGAYADIYMLYLMSMVDFHNNETTRYNNSSLLFNTQWGELAAYINRTYMPRQQAAVRSIF